VQRRFGSAQQAVWRVARAVVRLPERHAGEPFHGFAHVCGGVDVKTPLRYGLANISVEHEVAAVALRHQHPLFARQPLRLAHAEEALDLFVHAADGQHVAKGVERTGDGDALPQRHA